MASPTLRRGLRAELTLSSGVPRVRAQGTFGNAFCVSGSTALLDSCLRKAATRCGAARAPHDLCTSAYPWRTLVATVHCSYGGVVYRENVAKLSDWYVFSIADITAALTQ